MRIATVGGGPGGLYASLLLAKDPAHEVTLFEKNLRGATYGWGVVFSDRTLASFREADLPSFEAIIDAFVMWDVIEVRVDDDRVRCGGQVFSGISRRALLEILNHRCEELGVSLIFEHEIAPEDLDDFDLVVAADGIHSRIRESRREVFGPRITHGRSRYIWFGTSCPFDSFTFIFRRTRHGLFQAHVYPYDGQASTFIVETDERTWRAAGLDGADEATSIAICEELFGPDLRGHPLMSNQSSWLSFPTLRSRSWWDGNVVLVGDAAHTAHFSIGSGTKLAMEDAIALARAVGDHDPLARALDAYQSERKPIVSRFQEAAAQSRSYFESTSRYTELDLEQFVFHLLTRSGRVDYAELRLKDAQLIDRVDRWFGARSGVSTQLAPPPALAPLRLGDVTLPSRWAIGLPPPDAADGVPAAHTDLPLDFPGAALVMIGDVCVSQQGRITSESPGLYRPEHAEAWARLIAGRSGAEAVGRVGVRLVHAGRRGATRSRAEGLDRPALQAWPLLAPSAIAYGLNREPRPMTRADMDAVRDDYVAAARSAPAAGFDALCIDTARGYLLGSFVSPLTNRRDDDYGGTLANRIAFPLEVFAAVREVWDGLLMASVCASDEARGGIAIDDVLELVRRLGMLGCHLIEVTTGYTVPEDRIRYDPYSLPSLSDRIRNECGIATMISRPIATIDRINTLVASGRTDLCVLGHTSLGSLSSV